MLHNEYLTDEELEQLISEAETDLIPAPPELMDNILNAINKTESQEGTSSQCLHQEPLPKEKAKIKRKKNFEFTAYCFRVIMATAAAIAFVFIMPYLPLVGAFEEESLFQERFDEEAKTPEMPEWDRDDIIDYPTREEVLNDTGILQKVFGEDGIFTGSNDFNNMKEENGGE